MFDPEFFPTPFSVAMKMWSEMRDCSVILEPSAGRGDLVEAAPSSSWGAKKWIDCIEPNPELRLILKGKGYNLIHDDFMTFEPHRHYDGIIMNPPFSKGVDHLLRAFDLLDSGMIVCLLNSETVNNRCSRKRELLGKIIEDNGKVVGLGPCFSAADRSTNVDVSMVVIKKDGSEEGRFGFFDDIAEDRDLCDFSVDAASGSDLEIPDVVDTMVRMYDLALDAHADFLRAKNKVLFYTKYLSGRISQIDLMENTFADDSQQYNKFLDTLNEACWDEIFERTSIKKFVTNGVRKEFESFRDTNKFVDFTRQNIEGLLNTLGMSAGTIMEAALLKVFDDLTRYDKKNTAHIEGWKTNDFWRVNRKVIIPNIVEVNFSGNPGFHWWSGRDGLDDIDRVMCSLAGKDFDQIVKIRDGLATSFEDGWGASGESEFFTMKFYKKGTVHLTFKSETLLADFNRAAAKGKNWLGGDR